MPTVCVKMKSYVFCGLLFCLVANFGDGAILQRRLRDGNSIHRKLRSCNVICAVKNTVRVQSIPQKCYQLQKPNITISECVYNCLRFKREQLQNVTECVCMNGGCIDPNPSTASQQSTSASGSPVSNGVTNPTANGVTNPTTNGATNPTTNGATNPTTNGATNPTTNGATNPTTTGNSNPNTSTDEGGNTDEEFATALQRSTAEEGDASAVTTTTTAAETSAPTTDVSDPENEVDDLNNEY